MKELTLTQLNKLATKEAVIIRTKYGEEHVLEYFGQPEDGEPGENYENVAHVSGQGIVDLSEISRVFIMVPVKIKK
jgi:hypothetical protein